MSLSARLDNWIDGIGLGASYVGFVVAAGFDYCQLAIFNDIRSRKDRNGDKSDEENDVPLARNPYVFIHFGF